jgi:aspartyl-tRNA(Asn)/glutamyl-tRNA(Gln) amidotransferase subunit B
VPLIEIVSQPDLRSAEEAGQFLTEVRRLLRYLEICDGNMEEGSMRCDANISVRLHGAAEYGNRCEVKNLNSIRNVQRAIEHEFARQVEVIEAGGHIDQNTLNFNADTGETSVLRSKEMANDYRYFPEPDLLPVQLTDTYLDEIRKQMPALPKGAVCQIYYRILVCRTTMPVLSQPISNLPLTLKRSLNIPATINLPPTG